MREFALILFLLVVINPYEGRGIDYAEDEPQLYEYETEYNIEVYGPDSVNSEGSVVTEYTDEQIDRFIQKANRVINSAYPPYVNSNSYGF